ncbi:DgyrCDS11689 [Dimorphilus gyrociliatus]|uniref:DgyrCDS11689 n=1 Tax=Dimorphilus gyrociliatus TaxID=2664684 RepID=A0A7I8W576_9ANNE|nr:DgyrCDS11689 [Dimorphilus gyrociliatus]
MAGNFWRSSHCQQWLLDKQDLMRERNNDLKLICEEDYQKVMIFFANFIQGLGEAMKVRQQVVATATVFFRRFYAKNSLKSIDPLLMCPTALYLAAKVDEFGVLSNSRLIQACQVLVKNKFCYAFNQPTEFSYRINHVWECEFYLLELMDCCLIVFHPYRPLQQYVTDLCSSTDDAQLLQVAWRIINDTYRTDIPLLYPPYMIALSALHMACVINQKEAAKNWFAELAIDMEKIMEISKQIISLYELWKNYDETKEIKAILQSLPKPVVSRPPSQGPNDGIQNNDPHVSQA